MITETGEDVRVFVCPCGIEFRATVFQGELTRVGIQGAAYHACPETVTELTEILNDANPWLPKDHQWKATWALDPKSGKPVLSAPPPVAADLADGPGRARGASSPGGGGVVSRPPETPSRAPKPLPQRKVLVRKLRTSATSQGPDLVCPEGPARPSQIEPWGTDCDPRCTALRHVCRRPARVGLRTLTQVVYKGVDSLYWCAHAELHDNLLAALEVEKARARDGERILRELGGVMWQVGFNAGGRRHPYRLENEFAILGLAKKSKEGKTIKSVPSIKLTLKCEFMCEAGVKGAWEWARAFARRVHSGEGEPEEITSRLDMCVDVVGVDFGTSDIHDFVMRARKFTRHRDGKAEEDFDGMAERFVANYATVFTNVEDDTRRLEKELAAFEERRRVATARNRIKRHLQDWKDEVASLPEEARRWARRATLDVLRAKKTSDVERTVDKPKMREALAQALEAQAKKLARERGEPDPIYTGEHFSARQLTGYSFGKSEVSARIYDKTREIREQSRHKTWMYGVWAKSGWVSTETVWRVEVQLRREALKELLSRETGAKLDLDSLGRCKTVGAPLDESVAGSFTDGSFTESVLRERAGTPEARAREAGAQKRGSGLLGALPSLWTYMVGGRRGHTAWMKWCIPNPNDKKRANWKIREEWRVIQAVEWGTDDDEPLLRFKVRKARYQALLGQFAGLGTALSALRGPLSNGQAPDLYDLQADVDRYYKARGTNWDTTVNEKRVDYAMWDIVGVSEDEPHIKRALAIAVELSEGASTTDSREIAAKAYARARAEAN